MLNKKGQRELAYVVRIDGICAIDGADRVEVAQVGGWRIMVHKGQFVPGDLAIYFEIDSKVPEREPFLFLEPKHYKIKTQKYFKGTVISQG
ncbi:MAG: 2'-5' RNA ligase, partial [Lachnospiraceae bacterium]|nr:2'-5' RNA ligase [Lachnospiraceae bacterium]